MSQPDARVERPVGGSVIQGAVAGGFGFLCAIAAGAALVLAAKLQVPDLGADASPATVFESIVIVGLGGLGAPVEVGRAVVTIVPLGTVAVVCAGIASAARRLRTTHFPGAGRDDVPARA